MSQLARRRAGHLFRSALALLVVTAGWITLSAGQARAEASYDAFARTETFTGTISNPSIPTGIDIQGGGPQAAAHQSSLGVRDASAQSPYAGDTVPGLPGTGGALFNFPVPPYPFLAASNAGSSPRTVNYPGSTLHAESGDYTTQASSTAGQPGSGATAAAKVTQGRDGEVTAVASTAADTISLGPYFTLSDVRSLVTVVADATGKLTRTSTSSIGRISVPGLDLNIPKSSPGQIPIPVPIPGVPNQPPVGVPVYPYPGGGQALHDPDIGIQNGYFTLTQVMGGQKQTYLIPSGDALAAFRASGIDIRFQAPQETKSGLITGAYIFEYTIPAPPQNSYYNGATRISQTTAYALAGVDLTPEAVTPAPGLLSIPPITPAAGAVVPGRGSQPVPPAVPAPGAVAPAVGAGAGAAAPTRELIVAEPAVRAAAIKVGHGTDGPYLAVTGLGVLGALLAVGVRVVGGR